MLILDALTELFSLLNNAGADSTQRQIAQSMVHNLDAISGSNINQASEICHFSTATISRFCRQLGFDSYSEFRKSLRSSLSGFELVEYMFPNSQYSTETIVESYKRQVSEMYRSLFEGVAQQDITQMAEHIHQCKNVVMYVSASHLVHFFLQIDFALDKHIVALCRTEQELMDEVAKMGKGSYLLALKHQLKLERYVDEAVEAAKNRGAMVGVITNSERSPLRKSADDFICFHGTLYFSDNLIMDTCCMMLSATFREMYLSDGHFSR
ncbi:MurR/RpiR family transcriptional regulator [Ruminococcaceae bacterium OttesenSCG-928-D13]|nr:MurR/RpiR family transcriptional regulator [Ruminococcaceae bacterium OttesenSCG-928-D13]